MNLFSPTTLEFIVFVLILLPLYHRVLMWIYLWQLKEYRIDRMLDYLDSLEGKRMMFSKYFIIEISIVLLFIVLQFISEEDLYIYFMYIVAIYLLLLMLYDILKIYTKSFTKLRFTIKAIGIVGLTMIFYIFYFVLLYFYDLNYLGIYILVAMVISRFIATLSVFIINPIASREKNKKITKARQKISLLKNLTTIGITGSYGKTTTKEFLYQILKPFIITQKTPKNTNTEIGVAKVVLDQLRDDTQIFIAEMGAYKKGEIAAISTIVEQKIAILTGIDEQHCALFGGIEDIIDTKSEIFRALPSGGRLYANFDNEYIVNIDYPSTIDVITYALRNEADIEGSIIDMDERGTTFKFNYKNYQESLHTNIFGSQNILNLLPSIAIALDFRIDIEKIKSKLSKLDYPPSTFSVYKQKDNIIIDDTYNANPSGVTQAVLNLEYIKKPKKILVLDDILELGSKSKDVHMRIANIIAHQDLTYIALVGANYSHRMQENISVINEMYKGRIIIDDDEKLVKILKETTDSVVLFEGRQAGKYIDLIIK